ncbi:MAG: M20/M25/M40 family metallo-hydrolase [Thermoproteota archaeon]
MPKESEINLVYNYIDQNLNRFVSRIQEFVRQPSISAENRGVQEAAKLLASYFKKIGCQNVEIVPTRRHPVVYAELDSNAETTLLVYMMYDTQPVDDEKLWVSPPFEANIVPLDLPSGKVSALIGRGSINTKGPLITFINAVEAIVSTLGKLPVNLKFIAEGEEELGSPHLPDFVNEYKNKLKGAKATIFPSFLEDTWGKVKLSLGNKGIVYFELEASGKNWGKGPIEFDIHSSNKAWIDSPTWRLIDALQQWQKTMEEQ